VTTTEEKVEIYLKLRDRKAEISRKMKAEIKKVEDLMDALDLELLGTLDEQGLESMRVGSGTVFSESVAWAKVTDFEALCEFVRKHGLFDIFPKRVSKEIVERFMELNEGRLPDGVGYGAERKLRVRRK
jgi:hypothetical protein